MLDTKSALLFLFFFWFARRKKDDEESPVEKMSVSEIVGGDCTVEKRVPKYNNYTFN